MRGINQLYNLARDDIGDPDKRSKLVLFHPPPLFPKKKAVDESGVQSATGEAAKRSTTWTATDVAAAKGLESAADAAPDASSIDEDIKDFLEQCRNKLMVKSAKMIEGSTRKGFTVLSYSHMHPNHPPCHNTDVNADSDPDIEADADPDISFIGIIYTDTYPSTNASPNSEADADADYKVNNKDDADDEAGNEADANLEVANKANTDVDAKAKANTNHTADVNLDADSNKAGTTAGTEPLVGAAMNPEAADPSVDEEITPQDADSTTTNLVVPEEARPTEAEIEARNEDIKELLRKDQSEQEDLDNNIPPEQVVAWTNNPINDDEETVDYTSYFNEGLCEFPILSSGEGDPLLSSTAFPDSSLDLDTTEAVNAILTSLDPGLGDLSEFPIFSPVEAILSSVSAQDPEFVVSPVEPPTEASPQQADTMPKYAQCPTPRRNGPAIKPCFPAMENNLARLITFQLAALDPDWKWPSQAPKIMDMVTSGFFFIRSPDVVQCFHCGVKLFSWREEDTAADEHLRHAPHCVHMAVVKGQDFVDLLLPTLAPGEGETKKQDFSAHPTETSSTRTLLVEPSVLDSPSEENALPEPKDVALDESPASPQPPPLK